MISILTTSNEYFGENSIRSEASKGNLG